MKIRPIFLYNFNNYHSRKIRYFSDISDYYRNVDKYDGVLDSKGNPTTIDFNPNDGITTAQIVNWGETYEPDYMLALDDYNNIVSRWFVMEWKRTRGSQYQCTLRRDVVADHYNKVIGADSYIMKAMLPNDGSDTLIFNNESMTYNQKKVGQELLKDNTGSAWIVGYLSRKLNVDTDITATKYDTTNPDITSLIVLNDSENPTRGAKARYLKGAVSFNIDSITTLPYPGGNLITGFKWQKPLDPFSTRKVALTASSTNKERQAFVYKLEDSASVNDVLDMYIDERKNVFLDHLNVALPNTLKYISLLQFQKLKSYANNGTVVTINGNEYRIRLSGSHIELNANQTIRNNDNYASLYADMDNAVNELVAEEIATKQVIGNPYTVTFKAEEYSFIIEEASTENQINVKIPTSRAKLSDAPYDMFFMEYNEMNLLLAQQIVTTLTSEQVYDIQILPYAPTSNVLAEDGTISITSTVPNVDYATIKDGQNNVIGYMYFATSSSRTFGIDYIKSIEDYKIESETEFCRLVSPNWNGSYEFVPAKNGGINGFSVDVTYKPYTPYIHVAPIFGGLYGIIQDARGLICNGDFSITMMNSAWQTYELNNKNYQNIFDTQIKTMDKNNALSLASSITSSVLGAGAMGIGAGIMTGNPIIGAVSGGLSAIGGAVDIGIGQAQYQNNKQAMIDQFGYSLGNIKARPDTLTKVSTLNVNNMIFPFIEFYSATQPEVRALKEKIKHNGMTVMTINKISSYLDYDYDGFNYVSARIIHMDASMDYHMMSEIDRELQMGVYFKYGNTR